MHAWCRGMSEEDIRFLRTGVTIDCKPQACVGSGKQTWIFCKSRRYC